MNVVCGREFTSKKKAGRTGPFGSSKSGRLDCELARAFGPEPGILGGLGDLHYGCGSERVAGSVCLRSDFIELPDSPDPFPSQDRQGKLFGEGVGAGHLLCPPRFGIAIYLVSGASQTGDALAV
jgi:hypothetical protein